RADSTCRRLNRLGYTAEALHSDRSQNQRRRALENFASGTTDILVATDVLARGIDVEGVSYVVNFDLPTMPEDYVHRIGRTGRAGADGFALSYVTPETEDALRDIQAFIKREIPVIEVPGFSLEAAAAEAAERANRASARKDPEIAQAAKELKQKKRRKERAQKRAAEEAQAQAEREARKKAAPKKPKAPKPMKTSKAKYVKVEDSPKAGTASKAAKGKKATAPAKATTKATAKVAPKASAKAVAKASPKPAASRPEAKQDMRPGRARRAAVAKQRGKR
ncbi:MAG: DEAD/DEAH box helicase, partial [Eggerthellaceae bacterium]|nr:DEAD/DEAH box helicase [Eggerthellaceae bacterium]